MDEISVQMYLRRKTEKTIVFVSPMGGKNFYRFPREMWNGMGQPKELTLILRYEATEQE